MGSYIIHVCVHVCVCACVCDLFMGWAKLCFVHFYCYIYSTKLMYYSVCIEFTINGYLCCSNFLALISNAAVNILLYIFWCVHAHISVRYMPSVGLVDQRVCTYLIFSSPCPQYISNFNGWWQTIFRKELYQLILPLPMHESSFCLYSTFWAILCFQNFTIYM